MPQTDMNRKFSVIIPVFGEADGINALLAHVQAIAPHGTQIVVADGHPEHTTLAAISNFPEVVRCAAPKGRAVQMNAGAHLAEGEILLFLHADTRLACDAFAVMNAAIDAGHPAGAFDLYIDAPGPLFALMSRLSSLRSRLTRIPYGDQAQFFRRDIFDRLGGYPEIPLMEDVEIMLRLKRLGLRPAISRRAVHTSARRWQKEGVWSCTLRNWTIATLYYLGVSASRLARFYT